MGLDAHIDWLRQQIHKAAPTYCVLRRGDLSCPFTATKGNTIFQADQSDEYVHSDRMMDFLITPTDLVLAGSTAQPQPGDEIDELDGEGGNIVQTYAVAPESGVGPWEWSDQWRRMMRVHALLIGDDDE